MSQPRKTAFPSFVRLRNSRQMTEGPTRFVPRATEAALWSGDDYRGQDLWKGKISASNNGPSILIMRYGRQPELKIMEIPKQHRVAFPALEFLPLTMSS